MIRMVQHAHSKSAEQTVRLAVLHVHDEASLRLRSLKSGAGTDSRYSKIQNNIITASVGGTDVLPWLCPLQPVQRKDGDTIATCILQQLELLLQPAVGSNTPLRIIHLLLGLHSCDVRIVFLGSQ